MAPRSGVVCQAPQGPFGKITWAFWGHINGGRVSLGSQAQDATQQRTVLDSFLLIRNWCPVNSHAGGKPVYLSLEPNSILRISVKWVNTELAGGCRYWVSQKTELGLVGT